MAKIQPITTRLPKTGTTIIKFINNGKLKTKIVIPGPKNSNRWGIEKMITSYVDGKPKEIGIKYHTLYDAMFHHEELQYNKSRFKSIRRS